jgi:hypothetical protein
MLESQNKLLAMIDGRRIFDLDVTRHFADERLAPHHPETDQIAGRREIPRSVYGTARVLF